MRSGQLPTRKPSRVHRPPTAGQGLVEMVILLPLLLILLLGIIDFCRVFYAAIAVTQAARAGAQYGAQSTAKAADFTGIQNAATNGAPNLGPTPIVVLPTPPRYCLCPGATSPDFTCSPCPTPGTAPNVYVTVTAQYTFNTFAPYVPVYPFVGLPNTVDLRRTAIMRVQ